MRNNWKALQAIDKDRNTPSNTYTVVVVIGVLSLVTYSLYYLGNEYTLFSSTSEDIEAKISWYWPPLLGPNCARAKNGECVSHMASGEPWENWVDRAVACPKEYPFGTIFIIDGRRWVCMDRGGAIVRVNDNTIWLDMLTRRPLYRYGTVVDVTIIPK